jgi:hypothetical protein
VALEKNNGKKIVACQAGFRKNNLAWRKIHCDFWCQHFVIMHLIISTRGEMVSKLSTVRGGSFFFFCLKKLLQFLVGQTGEI